ncbi:hypothetical protein [Seleniivibrio woodruffii]|uniref:Uncharacterized protein n=1 Tax=Seleniivibrio woodruffii TaxID=1078050 RepID=A0A4R1K6N3_9BACT|nr:hypothetical protein [Seleniivibrio woodruffii]TCK59908.1 hypothetical protein C8D98_2075 [Seleniivibrio woodruffii]TVZ35871.1 hypothetical protein OF66_1491 [Seleniivibrio woodruffii]
MKHLNLLVKKIVRDHHTVFFIGVVLIIMGLISLSENLFKNILGVEFNIAYGYLILGAFNIIAAFAFIIMGAMNIETAVEPDSGETDRLADIENRLGRLEERIGNEI